MGCSKGYRSGTRDKFSKAFRDHGTAKLSKDMVVYHRGDLVDIKVNSAVHKGMPHKYYHGRTGVVFNVSKSSLGVIVKKVVGNKEVEKRLNVRIEHVSPSKSRDEFLKRMKENREKLAQARATNTRAILKRQPKMAPAAHIVSTKANVPMLLRPIPYDSLI